MRLRDIDQGFVNKMGATLDTTNPDRPFYKIEVEGIKKPVPLLFGFGEEWWQDYSIPAFNVTRLDILPDPGRRLPGFRAKEISENPATPNTFNIQKDPPEPVLILYQVDMVAESQTDMNAMLEHCIFKVGSQGIGTFLTVFDRVVPFRLSSVMNLSERRRERKQGRLLRWTYTYVVEAWLATTECIKVPQILVTDVAVEAKDYAEPLTA